MYYTIGEHIDLTYLNKTASTETMPDPKPSLFSQAVESGQAVGTQIMFKLEGNKITSGRRIPVQFA